VIPKRDSIKTLSLFSGAGGLDIGFHQAGFDVLAAVEIEPAFVATLQANSGEGRFFGPGAKVHCEDVRLFDPTPYVDAGIECIIGGPPCQTFSAAGRRSGGVLGLDDERGQLFRAYIRVLEKIQPELFVFENVYGLPGANGGGPWQEILTAFKEAGYEVTAEVVDAADYGAPTHRERLIMVGSRIGAFRFPMPTHGPDSNGGPSLVTALEAIADLQDPSEVPSGGPGGLYGHLLPLVPPGLNYSYFTKEMGHPAPQFAWRSKFHDFLHKADPSSPVRTLKSKPGKFTGPFHWNNRHFTAPELLRLQSFPDGYVVVGNYGKIMEQIGNSVPPKLAEAMAIAVKDQLLRPGALTHEIRPPGFKSTFRERQRERTRHFKEVASLEVARLCDDATRANLQPEGATCAYWVGISNRFDRLFDADFSSVAKYDYQYSVTVSRNDDLIHLVIREPGVKRPDNVAIEILGLRKYLDHTDRVMVTGLLSSVDEMINAWSIVEYELIKQSRFFSLVDIYGHYANRGDVVSVVTRVSKSLGTLSSAVSYFGTSDNCGIELQADGGYTPLGECIEPDVLLDSMRRLRWDVRSNATHPTLAPGILLCTYPFPALSPRAHFDKPARQVATVHV